MKGEKREIKDFGQLYVGFAEAKVVSICPDMEQLEAMGISVEKEPEYLKDDDGVDTARLDIYFKDVKKDIGFKKSYFLKNQEVIQKVKDDWSEEQIADFVPKTQYINQVGDTAWVVDEADLPQRFTKFQKKIPDTKPAEYEEIGDKQYRVALQGEGDLMDFCRKWLAFNYQNPSTDILLDMKKIFNGNFKELQDMVGSDLCQTTVEPLTVKTVEKEDGDVSTYQSVYKTSLPGYLMKTLRTVKFTETNIESWRKAKKTKDNPDGRYLKTHEQFAVDITGEWGSKDYFELVPMKPYEPSEDTIGQGTTAPKAPATDDATY